ncbi:tRNA (adenosine(37)-N6)-dimethylallyltransferase MiaA [candidate division GN15 bacterium]|uniref:tRNA dimethylallyltransferase n=1 Tax=candidate division GN15 bacterium TaxID=2072418 RepID=A0A855WUV9_9BACT|nr:MAG: tRNA (adenosine(37)-N6)-dimethylallyltransferase MiaA [candidate division GN15 bacterium]
MLPIPIICGPTASGKTSLALALAAEYPIEIVSADSRQLVRHLDIGTAKPTAEEQARVPFHLIDVIEPGERYSAFRYIGDASLAIDQILKRGRIPVVVGGTGLYLRALTDGVVEIDQSDMTIRDQLEREMAENGPQAMYERLKQIDPLEAAKIHPHNRVRVIRALEIFHLTGKSKSEITATGGHRKPDYAFEYFCLAPPRAELYETINRRVDRMVGDGLVTEFESLLARGYLERIRRANIIGYNELIDWQEGRWSLDEAVASIKQNTRRYAKRQMTWFRGQTGSTLYETAASIRQKLRLK